MEQYLKSILGNLSQGIFFIDFSGKVTIYNAAAELMLGLEREKVVNKPFSKVVRDDFFGFSLQQALAAKKAPPHAFLSLTLHDGRQHELEIETSFVLEGMILMTRDITEYRRLQAVANRNDRMKELGEMAAVLAHEIRNPLGGIKGFASLLVRDLKDNQKTMAQHIVQGTETLERLVTNVLHYTRPLQIKVEPVDLVPLLKTFAEDPSLKISYKAPSSLILSVDQQLLCSAILNLLRNAKEAGGTITLSLKEEEGSAVIQVKDTGVGIPSEHLRKLFTPFFTTKASGHGLGLAEVFKVVQGHHGTIDVTSKEGKGTLFTIKIPIG